MDNFDYELLKALCLMDEIEKRQFIELLVAFFAFFVCIFQ